MSIRRPKNSCNPVASLSAQRRSSGTRAKNPKASNHQKCLKACTSLFGFLPQGHEDGIGCPARLPFERAEENDGEGLFFAASGVNKARCFRHY